MHIKNPDSGRRLGARLGLVVAIATVALVTLLGSGATGARADGTTNGTFQFNTTAATVTEGGTACIQVNRSGGTAGIQNVEYYVTFGGAATSADLSGFGPTPGNPAYSSFSEGTTVRMLDNCIAVADTAGVQAARTATFTLSTVFGGGVLGAQTTFVLTIADNDGPGITVSPTSGLVTSESGTQATFTVKLNSLPTASVSIGLTSSDTTEGTVSPASLTFTTGNWSSPQTVTVTGVEDVLLDGNVAYTIVTAAAAGGDYAGIDASDVSVTNNDNDFAAAFVVTPTSGLTTTEAGGQATFTVRLTTLPSSDVTTTIVSSNVAEGIVSPASLTFTALNATTPQTVTVTGVDDGVIDGNIPYTIITGAASSLDGAYNLLNPADVSVTNVDNDGTGVVQFQSATYSAVESTLSAVITLTRSGSTAGVISVDCTTLAGGTAGAGVDYTAGSFTATFASGFSQATCTIPLLDDLLAEGGETVFLSLTNLVGGGSISGQTTATLTIGDNETALPIVTSVSPAFGPTVGGTIVTITGANFTGAVCPGAGVTFGGTNVVGACTVTATTITATAPAHIAGLVEVVVTTGAGGNTTVGTANDYTYTDGPTVTAVDPVTGPASGSPLTYVSITGTAFVSVTSVTFGGTAATSFTTNSTTSITAIAPAHSAGIVDIRVTTPGGTSPNTTADDFTYTGSAAPVVTGISPSSGPVGTVVTITGSGFTGVVCPSGITFGGVVADSTGCSVSSDSTITAKVPAAAPGGSIDIRVTRSGETSANTAADNFTNTSAASTITYSLSFRFTLIGWAGIDNLGAAAALKGLESPDNPLTNNVSGIVTAIWQFDTVSQTYKGYFPGAEGVPGANDFTTLRKGVGYFIAISTGSATWIVIQG